MYKTKFVRMLLCISTIGTAALVFPPAFAENATNTNATVKPRLGNKDVEFLMRAVYSSALETTLSGFAARKSARDDIREFSAQMLEDHKKSTEELLKIAKAYGVTVTTEPDVLDRKLLVRLEQLKDAQFDKEYVIAHQRVIDKEAATFEKEAKFGSEEYLKRYAENRLLVLQSYKKIADGLKK